MAERIIKLPDVGEGVAEAEVAEWHVAVGDTVREDQVLAAVTTDKVTVEIPSPVSGRVVALGAATGTVLAVGAELINRPEVAIIGVNKVAARPTWRGGTTVPRQMMNLSPSFDRRVIGGRGGGPVHPADHGAAGRPGADLHAGRPRGR